MIRSIICVMPLIHILLSIYSIIYGLGLVLYRIIEVLLKNLKNI